MARKLKLPDLSTKAKLLSFDLETNGLHGQAFAVGAVLVGAKGEVLDQFSGRTQITGQIDPWIEKHVLPVIEDLPINHESYEELREAFWQWYKEVEPKSDYVLVNNGYPVEYRFLLECQEADLANRYWDHPFPILDLSSLLIQVGELSFANKEEFSRKLSGQFSFKQHHPLHDAISACLRAFEAFRRAYQIK